MKSNSPVRRCHAAETDGQALEARAARETKTARIVRQPICFEVDGSRLVGMLDLPPEGMCRKDTGIVMLNSDDGCRLGPHRLWIRLAERLCREGYPCLRFDYRGCGDSEGPEGSPPGHAGLTDALAAERFLRERAGVVSTTLVGICYGAEIALLAARCRPTVCGGVACSAGRYVTTAGYGHAVRYGSDYVFSYARKLLKKQTWRKLILGQVNGRVILGGLMRKLSPAQHQRDQSGAVEAEALAAGQNHQAPSLFIYGTADPLMRKHEPGYRREAVEQKLSRSFVHIAGADHNFSSLPWSEQVIRNAVSFVRKVSDTKQVERAIQ